MTALHIDLDREELASICRGHHVARLALFGSVLRDDFGPRSDIDVLVEFAPHAKVGLLSVVRLQMELSDLLKREVHLSTPRSLSPYFRDRVIETAVPVYVAA